MSWRTLLCAIATLALTGAARAEDAVKIGVLLPGGSTGAVARAAIEVGRDIIDKPHPGLETLTLGAGRGLPHLNGATVSVVFADNLGNPSVAQSQLLRLAAHDHVIAVLDADNGAAGGTADALADRHGLPLVVAAAPRPDSATAGSGWVFHTGPTAGDFAQLYADFLAQLKAAGTPTDRVALVFEKTSHAAAAAATLRKRLTAAEFEIALQIDFAPNTNELSGLVKRLRDAHPAVAILVADAADAALLVKTMKALDYRPPLLIGDDFGFSDQDFVAAAGYLAQGLVNRSAWSAGKPGSATAIINSLYKTKLHRDLDDAGARILQGFLVLADAIDRAGAADPTAIRQALRQTDLGPKQLVAGYRGVRFDDSGRNALASGYLLQLQGKDYATVWPDTAATATLRLPYRGWR